MAAELIDAGHRVVVYTGPRWTEAAARRGIEVRELPGLAALPGDDDADAGAKLSVRAARMAVELAPLLTADRIDVVVGDVITLAGGWAAELTGTPWIELSPHPLYEQSSGLPPIGAGLDAGVCAAGRFRDRVLRGASLPAVMRGRRQRARARSAIGLSGDPAPSARFVATLPGLEVHRPDWPADTHLVGPLLFEPTDVVFDRPAGDGPLVVVAPSTAETGERGLGGTALTVLAELQRSRPLRAVYSALTPPPDGDTPVGLVAGTARQDDVVADSDLVICGAGHGMLAKTLLAGVPVVTVPGGGDQWELASRVARIGCGVAVRPVVAATLRAAVETVLDDPSYAAAARSVAATSAQTVDPVAMLERVHARAVG